MYRMKELGKKNIDKGEEKKIRVGGRRRKKERSEV